MPQWYEDLPTFNMRTADKWYSLAITAGQRCVIVADGFVSKTILRDLKYLHEPGMGVPAIYATLRRNCFKMVPPHVTKCEATMMFNVSGFARGSGETHSFRCIHNVVHSSKLPSLCGVCISGIKYSHLNTVLWCIQPMRQLTFYLLKMPQGPCTQGFTSEVGGQQVHVATRQTIFCKVQCIGLLFVCMFY